ncbi:hypothetical protein TNCV_2244461 [Trichonephila clavipes]|nr:hypothetical protein TNCV_2244461 [Trichonephila clavipes]
MKLANLEQRWLDSYKWPENGLLAMESISNKWYCPLECRTKSQNSINISTESLLVLSARLHLRTTAPQLVHDLAAVFGRRIFS